MANVRGPCCGPVTGDRLDRAIALNANMSATPLALGTAGTIEYTPDPLPGLDQMTVPIGNAPAEKVTSAEASPAVMVTWPAERAVRTSGHRSTTAPRSEHSMSKSVPVPASRPNRAPGSCGYLNYQVKRIGSERDIAGGSRHRQADGIAPHTVALKEIGTCTGNPAGIQFGFGPAHTG